MENKNNLFEEVREVLQQQVKEAYIEGAHQGSITTCAIIYGTMSAAGLEEDNFLFDILRDIASQHGCKDLTAVVAKLREKNKN